MSDENALAGEMRRLLASLRSSPPPLDQVTADRLLAGRLDPADAPHGYAAVARLLAAAAAPPGPDELAGEHSAVAEFQAVVRSAPPTPTSRRAGMPSKRFSVKAIAVAVAAVMTIGGIAAAATDRLPGSARRVADEAPATTTHDPAPATQGAATTRQEAAGSPTGGQKAGTGPDASGAARDGLCRAWLAGKGGDHGKRDDSPAFQALARAAGGAAKIAAWCKAATASQTGRGRGPDGPPGPTTSPPSSGATPPGSGHGQGQGGPPTTG
jgi:hypothetical protein